MLSKADDYPIHQTPEPIAYAGTDRNFYDRYFFNGYDAGGSLFFAAALGVYPHLNIMDGAFCVVHQGVQHNLRVSRVLHMERMDTQVGPLAISVIEPLQRLAVTVIENEHGIRAELCFRARARAVEEPRFTRRIGPRTFMDYTRLTQNGCWSGWIEIKGKRFEIDERTFTGTRDRSWGIRPIGAADQQPHAPAQPMQFFWLWAPLNFADAATLFHTNDDEHGRPWNRAAVFCPLGDRESMEIETCSVAVEFQPGSRHARKAVISLRDEDGAESRIVLEPHWNFHMSGLGYTHPDWGHGGYKGELVVGYDCYDAAAISRGDTHFLHVQSFVTATMSGALGERKGCGVLEQLCLGPHAPSGFVDLLGPAA